MAVETRHVTDLSNTAPSLPAPNRPAGGKGALLTPCRTEVRILLTNQRTACVAPTCRQCPAPFQGLSIPTEDYYETSTAQSGSRPLFGGGNATRTAPLRTEPTRTLRWKCAIKLQNTLGHFELLGGAGALLSAGVQELMHCILFFSCTATSSWRFICCLTSVHTHLVLVPLVSCYY